MSLCLFRAFCSIQFASVRISFNNFHVFLNARILTQHFSCTLFRLTVSNFSFFSWNFSFIFSCGHVISFILHFFFVLLIFEQYSYSYYVCFCSKRNEFFILYCWLASQDFEYFKEYRTKTTELSIHQWKTEKCLRPTLYYCLHFEFVIRVECTIPHYYYYCRCSCNLRSFQY